MVEWKTKAGFEKNSLNHYITTHAMLGERMTELVRMNRRGKKRGYPGGDRGLPLGIFSYFSVYTILSATVSSAPVSSKKEAI